MVLNNLVNMASDLSSMQRYQLGTVSEMCPRVKGIKACATTTLFNITLEFRKQLTHRDPSVSVGIKGMGYYCPAQIFYFSSKSLQLLET